MAQLFKNKTLKAELKDYLVPDFDKKLAIVQSWHEAYKNGSLHSKTETQCEQAFNQSFFMEILGYKSFPNEIYTIDPKASTEIGGQKPDAILGYFNGETKHVVAVVEIKDVNTSLIKSQQREGNLSPIQQAFKYKPQFKDCSFVIATNFFELRLHRDNQLDFEKFTLSDLVSDKDDYFAFKKFYYLLNAENFVSPRGLSSTEKKLAEIRIEQENISKSFYKDYSKLRSELIRNIGKNNFLEETDFSWVVEKAQKIIDRIVFISFCEDLGLIPENKLQEAIHHTEKLGLPIPVWEILKSFFLAVDRGNEAMGIKNGYNGELFKEDDKLSSLIIDDDICKKFAEFGKYDFEEDLSVNILGHIFEQSITDIEELKSAATIEEIDQKISKRKKDGIFYTPDYIVEYIVANSVGVYLQDLEGEILAKYKLKTGIKDSNYEKRVHDAYLEYWERIKNIKILDPACGSGAFLVKVFDFLLAEHQRVGEILGLDSRVADFTSVYKNILQKNIFGVDLNPESVEITKLSLWLKTANKGQKLVTLKDNIKCGNSIVDNPQVSISAFNWNTEFADIMNNGGFDVILGNPPYVRQELVKEIAGYLEETYESFSGKADLFVYFFEKAAKLLKTNGRLGFISSGKFFEAKYGKPLVDFLINNFQITQLVNFGDLEVFENVSAYPIIFLGQKCEKLDYDFDYVDIDTLEFSDLHQKVLTSKHKKISKNNFIKNEFKFFTEEISALVSKLWSNSSSIEDYCGLPVVGIKTGFNEGFLGISDQRKFVMNYIFGEDIKRYTPLYPTHRIIFPYKKNGDAYTLASEEELVDVFSYLEPKRTSLEKRAIIKDGLSNGTKKWYEYQQINLKIDLDKKYIVYPNVSLGNNFTFSSGNAVDMTGFILQSESKFLLGVLNSKITKFIMELYAISRRGGYLEYKVQYIEKVPVPKASHEVEMQVAKYVDSMLDIQNRLQGKILEFHSILRQEFKLEKINRKLEFFYNLDFDAFIDALDTNLSLEKKADLFRYFEKSRSEIILLKQQSDECDGLIDDLIFKLFDLTPTERSLIENY